MSSIDVIVPCYRYGQFLRECVQSVLSQSGLDIRVLIINDASPDNTADIAGDLLREDSRIRYLQHDTNKGHIYTYNEGIDWASSDYLLLLSADDYLLPGALQRAVALMERHHQVGLTFGNAVEIDPQGGKGLTNCLVCQDGERILTGAEFIALSGPRNIVPTPTAVVRTALQKKVGGYRKELPHAGDMELWFRLATHGPVGFVESAQAVYRRHASNMSLSYAVQRYLPDLEQRKAALDCFFESCGPIVPNSVRLRRTMFYILALDAVGLASSAFNDGELVLADQLSAFAIRSCVEVKRSWAWAMLTCKRRMGPRMWQTLQPTANRMRRTVGAAVQLNRLSLNAKLLSRRRKPSEACSEAIRLTQEKGTA